MASVLRIQKPAARAAAAPGQLAAAGDVPNPAKEYIERLVKLIPAEVVGLYLAGKSGIQAKFDPDVAIDPVGKERYYWIIWTLACFLAVIAVRAWATRDPAKKLGPQKFAVFVAAVSFLSWIYTLGDVFQRVWPGIWEPLIGLLWVLLWTFAVPFFYQGEDPA